MKDRFKKGDKVRFIFPDGVNHQYYKNEGRICRIVRKHEDNPKLLKLWGTDYQLYRVAFKNPKSTYYTDIIAKFLQKTLKQERKEKLEKLK